MLKRSSLLASSQLFVSILRAVSELAVRFDDVYQHVINTLCEFLFKPADILVQLSLKALRKLNQLPVSLMDSADYREEKKRFAESGMHLLSVVDALRECAIRSVIRVLAASADSSAKWKSETVPKIIDQATKCLRECTEHDSARNGNVYVPAEQ